MSNIRNSRNPASTHGQMRGTNQSVIIWPSTSSITIGEAS